METHENEEWTNHDMPHEAVMDRKGLNYSDMSATIQREMRLFDTAYEEALKDGYMDEQEEQQLITKSYNIAKQIEQEHPAGSDGSMTVGIFSGIMLAVGAVIGIKQFTKL